MHAEFAGWMRSVDARLKKLEAQLGSPVSAGATATTVEAPSPSAGDAQISEADIRAAYRLLLDREPDAEGFATYRTRAADGLSRTDLVDELLDSNERAILRAGKIVEVDLGEILVSIDRTEREFGRAIARDHVWEAHIVQQIRANLAPGAVFVDIGANIGVMSFHAAKTVGPAGKVIAFEPNPDNVQRFLQGVRINGFENIRLLPLAASAAHSIFSIKGSSNTHLEKAELGERLVASIPADSVLAAEPRIDLIKIDVEGHEPMALAGLAGTLRRLAPLVLCEFNPRCLRAAGGVAPEEFAASLFERAAHVDVVEHDGTLRPVATSIGLMALWAHRNAEHVAKGDLADGMVHFDLLIRYAESGDGQAVPTAAEAVA